MDEFLADPGPERRDDFGACPNNPALTCPRAVVEQRYRGLFENALEGIFRTSPEGVYLDANPALARMYGYASPQELLAAFQDIGMQLYADPGRREEFKRLIDEQGEVVDFESRIRRRDGEIIWIRENARGVFDRDGKLACYEGLVIDITARKRAEESLREQQALLSQLFANSPLAIALLDSDGYVRQINQGYQTLFGFSPEEVDGRRNRELIVSPDLAHEALAINRTVLAGNSVHRETVRQAKDGRLVPVSIVGFPVRVDETISGLYYIYADISERKAYEEQLAHQAFHDSLTGLPNRALFLERLGRAVERAKRRPDYAFALLMIDLDRFKWINDALGHQAGDELLKIVSSRISRCIRAVDTAARLGGDEFAILLEEFAAPREVIQVAKRLLAALEEPSELAGALVQASGSIGLVLNGRRYSQAEHLLRDADIAMYRAKELGRARFKVFNKKMHKRLLEEIELDSDLRRALTAGELRLHYQPIMNVGDGRLKGFEALVRWDDPKRGLVSPAHFIPLAEETGLIIPLGQWVLREACCRMAAWVAEVEGASRLSISVNLSARQFMQPDLAEFIAQVLSDCGLPPQRLILEITETAIMRDPRGSQLTLQKLKELGVRISIDDFGTGYSSFSYLQQFPVDQLKIDRSFISGRLNPERNREIASTIIALGRNLGVEVVAEGVEELEQLDWLRQSSCGNAQGFLFSRAVGADEALGVLRVACGADGEDAPDKPDVGDRPAAEDRDRTREES